MKLPATKVMDVNRCPRCQGTHKSLKFLLAVRPIKELDPTIYVARCPKLGTRVQWNFVKLPDPVYKDITR